MAVDANTQAAIDLRQNALSWRQQAAQLRARGDHATADSYEDTARRLEVQAEYQQPGSGTTDAVNYGPII